MKVVLDASVALKAVLVETDSDKARQFLEDFRSGLHQLLAPDIFLVEVGHALTRAERKQIIPIGDAAIYFAELLTTAPALCAVAPLMARAIDLSSQMRGSVYDCLYLVLAEENDCEVITADRKFLRTYHGSGRLIDLAGL